MRRLLTLCLIAALTAPTFAAAESKFNVNINVGVPAPPLPPPPIPVGPKVFFSVPPLFLAPSSLGFYVGVDMPYDLVLVSGVYYLFQGNQWYRGASYNGPWVVTRFEQLPPPVRRYKVERIRVERDREFHAYRADHEHYRGRHYRPEKERKEQWKQEKRREKEEWKRDRDEERDERHDRGHHGRRDD